MTRKPKFLALMVLVVLSLTFVGCKKNAAPPLDISPEDEDAAMIQEAEDNTEVTAEVTAEPEDEGETAATPEPEDTSTSDETTEPTPTSLPEATPVPEPTEAPTQESDATPETAPIAMSGKHIVQPGENLFRIALKYGMTVETLSQINGITNPSLIYVGQELTISGSSSDPTPVPTPVPGGDTTYIVQPGENLFRIALKYNYDQYYLARYNNISNPALIYVGQVIRIP